MAKFVIEGDTNTDNVKLTIGTTVYENVRSVSLYCIKESEYSKPHTSLSAEIVEPQEDDEVRKYTEIYASEKDGQVYQKTTEKKNQTLQQIVADFYKVSE